MHIWLYPSTSLVVHQTVGVIWWAVQWMNLRYRLLIVFDHPSELLTIFVLMRWLGVYVDVDVQNSCAA